MPATITPQVRQILEGYSQGLFSAREAARRMGGDATIHDVIHRMREARIPLPRHSAPPEEVARARRMFGLTP